MNAPAPLYRSLPHLGTAQNLDSVRHQLCQRWHFRMLNDRNRNAAYRAAIECAVRTGPKDMRVLDIGTGSGLLALYAHQAGAKHVFACDDNPLMAGIAHHSFMGLQSTVPTPGTRVPHLLEAHSCSLSAADLNSTKESSSTADEDDDDGVSGRMADGDAASSAAAVDAAAAAQVDDRRCDLIVTETIDAGVFGEQILQTLQHAHANLLRPGGRIIPAGVQLYVAGFQSHTIAMTQCALNPEFGDLVYLKHTRLHAGIGSKTVDADGNEVVTTKLDEPYDTEAVHTIRDFRIITQTVEGMAVNFHDPAEIGRALSGEHFKHVRLDYVEDGQIDGFVVWFRLRLDDERSIHTAPGDMTESVDVDECWSSAQRCECWEQAIFKLNTRFANVERLSYLRMKMSCPGGRLSLQHYYGGAPSTVIAVPADTIRFVNDGEYLTRLEFEFARAERLRALAMESSAASSKAGSSSSSNGSSDKSGNNVLDLLAFPYIGLSMLKDGRAERLYCDAALEKVMRFVATTNCIDGDKTLRFVDGVNAVFELPATLTFDVILMSPIDAEHGVLDEELVHAYRRLRAERLRPGGRMVPHRIEVWGQLVRSEWLRRMTRVVPAMGGKELESWSIAERMNRFATRQQLGLGFFEHDCVSEPFRVADVPMCDGAEAEHHRSRFEMLELSRPIPVADLHGVLCYYKVWLTPESLEPVSTRRFQSHMRRMCYVFDEIPERDILTMPENGNSDTTPPSPAPANGNVSTPPANGHDTATLLPANGADCAGDDAINTTPTYNDDDDEEEVDVVEEEPQQPPDVIRTRRAVVHVRQHGALVDCRLYKRGSGGQQ